MIRFTSTQLRPLLPRFSVRSQPLILEKNLGIYIRVPDDRQPGEWLKAWAEDCNPARDENWADNVDALIPDAEYSFLTFMDVRKLEAILNEHHDLLMEPIAARPGATMTIRSETRPPEKVYVRVGEFRDKVSWLYDQSLKHFHACVGNSERLSWRSQALHVLDQVIRLDSKRAKPEDREMFERAVRSVRGRVNEVKSDGSLRGY
ncbi:hypothetical protein PO590_13675 [Raoultella ornithinolytica]|uniref:hypothetical protein n=1 Tax=Raoultella ornithinolytica TaxID=54291 RepID=UPI002FF72FDC